MFHSDYTVGIDAHKHFSLFAVLDHNGDLVQRTRVGHVPGAIRMFLEQFPQGTPVALETVGNWYWIVDEIEDAGCIPLLAHAAKAKVMMGNVHKTDKLDAQGLATLLYLGKLPSVWIPPNDVRDARELPRTRMAFSKSRASLKNRIHSTLAKYALSLDTTSDIFTPKWRPPLLKLIDTLPEETGRCMHQELELLELVQDHIGQLEARIKQRIKLSDSMQRVQSLPGVGAILAIVTCLEVGSIDRFSAPKHFASYCGLVPKVSASGGHVHYGRMVTPSRCPSGNRPTTTSSGLLSKLPTLSSATATIPTGVASTSSTSMNAPNTARAMPSPSAPPLATWRRPPIGFSKRVSPIGSPLTGPPKG